MNVLNTVRPVTEDDIELLNKRAAAFIKRHGIVTIDDTDSPFDDLELTLEYQRDMRGNQYYLELWQRIFCRALGIRYSIRAGIGWNTIGYWDQ